jgi:hypothetical protein
LKVIQPPSYSLSLSLHLYFYLSLFSRVLYPTSRSLDPLSLTLSLFLSLYLSLFLHSLSLKVFHVLSNTNLRSTLTFSNYITVVFTFPHCTFNNLFTKKIRTYCCSIGSNNSSIHTS